MPWYTFRYFIDYITFDFGDVSRIIFDNRNRVYRNLWFICKYWDARSGISPPHRPGRELVGITLITDIVKVKENLKLKNSTRWHLVNDEIQKCDFLNNHERYEHMVLFCLNVLFQSFFNSNVDDHLNRSSPSILHFSKI